MAAQQGLEYWTVWYPQAASTGLLLGRGLIEPTDILLVHAAPPVLTVEVTDQEGRRRAYGKDLQQTESSPICSLRCIGEQIIREDIWPTQRDEGRLVLLPGGEVGVLKSWWTAPDRKEWRWQVELYNSIRD